MANILHEYIKNYDDFLLTLKLQISNIEVLLRKKHDDSFIINSNNEQLLKYFKKERKRLIKKISLYNFVLKVDIKGFEIQIDKEDYNNLLDYIKIELFENKEPHELKKENAKYLTQYFNVIDKSIWIAFYNSKIEELKGGLKSDYNSLIFDKKESEEFFIFMVEKWLKEEANPFTALQYVFTEMWCNNTDKNTPYKIISTGAYFAREYWSLKYSNIHKIANVKNPKLNKDSFTEYYHKRFKNLLTEFKGG